MPFLKALLAGVFLLFVASCEMPRSQLEPDFTLAKSTEKAVYDRDTKILGKEQKEAVIDIALTEGVLVPQSLEKSDPLPDIQIKDFSAVDATVLETFRVLLLDEGVTVSADPALTEDRVTIFDLNGSLQDVLNRISEISGVYYTYKNGVLMVMPKRTFIVPLPPIEESFDGIAAVLESLGAENVTVDTFGRLVTFAAGRKAFDTIREYLDQIKKTKVLLVYETYIFEVQLKDTDSVGINWNKFGLTGTLLSKTGNLSLTGSNSLTDKSLTLGTVYSKGDFDLDQTIDFLRTQGDTEIISKPTITMISGGSSSFEVGEVQRFISQVRRTNSNFATGGGGAATNNVTVTFETEDLTTGLRVEILGDYVDETIFSQVNVELSDLISLDAKTFGKPGSDNETEVQLPRTSSRSLSTSVRTRPGDTILIAGINQSRDTRDTQGTPLGGDRALQTKKSNAVTRTEIVIIMTPRLIRFTPEKEQVVETVEADKIHNEAVKDLAAVPAAGRVAKTPQSIVKEEDIYAPENVAAYRNMPVPNPRRGEVFGGKGDRLLGLAPLASGGGGVTSAPAATPASATPEAYNRDIGDDPYYERFQYFKKDGSVKGQNN